jgi:8-oxo-dGTP pyrophosphatase MutT (NUDIX family)
MDYRHINKKNYKDDNINYKDDNNDSIKDNKIVILKKNYYCTNCNKKGHTYKKCNNPIISNGIICLKIDLDISIDYKQLSDYINTHFNSKIYIENINVDKDTVNKNIKFLLIQRKNSLGYLEFMRGRYDDDKKLEYLLEQMTQIEIDDIINREFDDLWNELWDINNIRNKNHYKEYTISKQKFYELRLDSNSGNNGNSSNIIKNTKPLYNFNEWGFPKGRRELYESDLICAMRELEEETFLKENDYIVLENCKKIKEYLTGTNGINYLHNYFIALTSSPFSPSSPSSHSSTPSTPSTSSTPVPNKEIGDIKYCDYNECIKLIRPYHLNKLKIIYVVYSLVNDYLQQMQL